MRPEHRFSAVLASRGVRVICVWTAVWTWAAAGAGPAPGGGAAARGNAALEELFGDIARNMDLIERMLQDRDSGPACQGAQHDVVKQIDKLIEELRERQQSAGGGGGAMDDRDSRSQGEQQAEKQQRDVEGQEGRKPLPEKPGGESGEAEPQDPSGKESDGQSPHDAQRDGRLPRAQVEGPLTEKDGVGGWGFLPGEIRALLESRGRTGVPPKYEGIIRRYFERLSDESR